MNNNHLARIGREAKTCVVFTVGGIGDHLFALPVFRALRETYPKLRVAQISSQAKCAEFNLKAGLVDQVFITSIPMGLMLETKSLLKRLKLWRSFIATTLSARLGRFDLSLFLASGLTRKLALWQALVGANYRITKGRSDNICNRLVHFNDNLSDKRHHIDQNLDLVRHIGCVVRADVMSYYREIFAESIKGRLGEGKVFIHPFLFSSVFCGRGWALENFLRVYEFLEARGAKPVIVGSPEELDDPCLQGLGTTPLLGLEQSARLLAGAKLVVGNDSSVVHLASMVGVPTLSITGSSNHRFTGPYQNGGVVRLGLPCSPCFARRGYLNCNHFSCIKQLKPEQVIAHPLINRCVENYYETNNSRGKDRL